MPLLVLLSCEENLKAEVESCLGGLAQPPSLIQVNSFEELEECLESLSDIGAVLLDLKNFDPPADFPLPLLLVGKDEDASYPSIKRPLHPESFCFVMDELLSGSPQNQPAQASAEKQQLDFVTSLLHEVVHDLNNQFTTLRGNIPLIREQVDDEDGSLNDIHHATERGTQLLHLLEVLDPDTRPDPGIFRYDSLLKDLGHFGKKMFPGLSFEEIPPNIQFVDLRGDPMLICNLYLQILWLFRSHTSSLRITHRLGDSALDIVMIPEAPLINPDELRTRLNPFVSRRLPGRMTIKSEDPHLIFSLPRVLQ